jgi:hypothetical protein
LILGLLDVLMFDPGLPFTAWLAAAVVLPWQIHL